jgi:hypothetical protein
MPTDRALAAVLASAERHFDIEFTFGPNTNLSSIADQTDRECLEWMIDELHREFRMLWPVLHDNVGRVRRPQMLIPNTLTVTDLAKVLDGGRWPDGWVATPIRFVD